MRAGNVIAATILAVAGAGLCARAGVALSQERPARPVANPASSTVDIRGFAFPATIPVAVGGAVSWVNRDGQPHTVTFAKSPAPDPAQLALDPGAIATATFAMAGSYEYSCQIHPSMTGRVEVSASTRTPDPYGAG